MEVKNGHNNKLLVCAYEFMGTAMLLLSINWGTLGPDQPIAVSGTVFAAILLFGPVSGAHYNGAVSIGVLVHESANLRKNAFFFMMIILSQIAGGFFGCFIAWLGTGSKNNAERTQGVATLCPPMATGGVLCNSEGAVGRVFFVETVVTFIFILMILNVKFVHDAGLVLNSICVSAILYGLILAAAGLSGAAINPVVGFVQSLFQFFVYQGTDPKVEMSLESMWIYVVAPATGGLLAGLWQKFHEKQLGDGNGEDERSSKSFSASIKIKGDRLFEGR